jgi:thioredoxin reductase
MRENSVDALVIGAGPAGLAAATRLRRLGVARVVVLEREATAGGVPRHCNHASFGLKEFGRPMNGPRYAAALLRRADQAAVEIHPETTVLEIGSGSPPHVISTSPSGLQNWESGAVILATGCRERPRPARLIPGTRAGGVFTTGELQQFTYLHQVKVGCRAVVVGAEHVSFSAVRTLHDAGIECVGIITPFANHQSFPPLRLWATGLGSVPLLTGHRLVAIEGRGRVSSVMVEAAGGQVRIECDTVILTGEWVAEGGLALDAGLSSDTMNGGRPEVSAKGATAREGVFAAGSVVHPGESAARANHAGVSVAEAVAEHLGHSRPASSMDLRLGWSSPIRWVAPQRAQRSEPVPLRLRVDQWIDRPTVVFRTDGHVLDTVRVRRLIPGRTYTFDGSWMGRVEESAADVQVSIGVDG